MRMPLPGDADDEEDEDVPRVLARLSREFEDVDLRRRQTLPISGTMATASLPKAPFPIGHGASDMEGATTARERMRSRAGRMLSRTRSFAPPRRSKSGVIDENAVPDPDVILLADAILASRPMTRSPPATPRREDDLDADGRGVTNFLRIGKPEDISDDDLDEDSTAVFNFNATTCGSSRDTSLERNPPSTTAAGAAAGHSRSGSGGGMSSSWNPALERGGSSGATLVVGGGAAGGGSSSSSLMITGESALRRRVDQLSAQLAATEAALRSAQEQSSHWEHCVHDLFSGLLLSPRMNARYEVKVSKMLERALTKLDQIESVRYVKCSFPSVASEAPHLKLRRWESLESSEWEVTFAPCWKIELCLEGRSLMMPFKLLVRVGSIQMKGELRLSFPPDLMHTLISFNAMPDFDMSIDSDVSLGSVPMPLQRGASALIRYELRKWLAHKAVAPHAMKIKRSPPSEVASAAASAAAAAEAAAIDASAAAADASTPQSASGFFSAQYGSSADSPPPPPPPPDFGAHDAAPTGGIPSHSAADMSVDAASMRANSRFTSGSSAYPADGLKPEKPKAAVSDEDLQRAILAAKMKHDNPRAGVGRSARGRGLSGGIRAWTKSAER